MSFVAGKGRYGRETYPLAPRNGSVVSSGGSPTTANKQMAASTTTADGQVASATAVAQTPVTNANATSGSIAVFVNGLRYAPGDGTKVGVPCYFSADGGVTARALKDVAVGDLLYWNGSVATFELASATDVIDFEYLVA